MSAQELQFMHEIGLTSADVADLLEISHQAAAKGLAYKQVYLTGQRASSLYSQLRELEEFQLAEDFRKGMSERFGVPPESFRHSTIRGFGGDPILNLEALYKAIEREDKRKMNWKLRRRPKSFF